MNFVYISKDCELCFFFITEPFKIIDQLKYPDEAFIHLNRKVIFAQYNVPLT